MNIHNSLTKILTESEVAQFNSITHCLLSNVSSIDSIHICDEENFGLAIRNHIGNDDYTDYNGTTAFGKTVSTSSGKSSIIIRSEIAKAIAASITINNNQLSATNDLGLDALKLLLHEAGHTITNSKKNIEHPNSNFSKGFKIREVLNSYYQILKDEFNAESYPIQVIRDYYFTKDYDLGQKWSEFNQNIITCKEKYYSDGDLLDFAILTLYQSNIYVFQQLFYELPFLLSLSDYEFHNRLKADLKTRDLFELLSDKKGDVLSNDIPEWLFNYWIKELTDNGYKFVEQQDSENDAFYF